jgi:hypothetical protein
MALTWASPVFKKHAAVISVPRGADFTEHLIAYPAWKIAAQKEELADSPS